MVLALLTIIATFFGMEVITWFTHKYVMHGFLWFLHSDHHEPSIKKAEKNDFFFLIFAIPSWLCIMLGLMYGNLISTSIGFGILLYGISYVIVHEIFIHQRIKWFKKTNKPYFKAIRFAHKIHHKKIGKEDGECFGMLFVPYKYYQKSKQEKRRK